MMKKLMTIVLTSSILMFSGCEKYLSINEDPVNPQVAQASILLPPIYANMARATQWDSRYFGRYIQNWGFSTGGDIYESHGYTFDITDPISEHFRAHYFGIGRNINFIINDAEKTAQWNYVGVAKAIRAWSWLASSDVYGEMILKQAFEEERYVFDYDTQQDIYSEVNKLSNEAIADLTRTDGNGTPSKLAIGDLVYKGDASKWIKFSYGLLARTLNHQSKKSTYNSDQIIDYCNKSLASNADNFNIPFNGSNTVDASFFGPTRNNLTSYRQSAFIVSLLNGSAFAVPVIDPRLSRMLTKSTDGSYKGVSAAKGDPDRADVNKRIPNVFGDGLILNTGTTGRFIFKDNAALPLMTYAEILFIKAEAAFRKGDLVVAYQAYKDGIAAHIDFVSSLSVSPITATEKTTYLASAAVAPNAAALTLSHIMTQKYIALWGHGFVETWDDLRRIGNNGTFLGYDPTVFKGFTLPSPISNQNNSKPVYRVRPRFNSELMWNEAAFYKIGGDKTEYHTNELWFMQP